MNHLIIENHYDDQGIEIIGHDNGFDKLAERLKKSWCWVEYSHWNLKELLTACVKGKKRPSKFHSHQESSCGSRRMWENKARKKKVFYSTLRTAHSLKGYTDISKVGRRNGERRNFCVSQRYLALEPPNQSRILLKQEPTSLINGWVFDSKINKLCMMIKCLIWFDCPIETRIFGSKTTVLCCTCTSTLKEWVMEVIRYTLFQCFTTNKSYPKTKEFALLLLSVARNINYWRGKSTYSEWFLHFKGGEQRKTSIAIGAGICTACFWSPC